METYIGMIAAFGFNFAPYQWAQCQGQLLAISSNNALFALLGTAFGGNGTSTFGLPNLQARSATGQGQLQGGSLYVMGETGGSPSATVSLSNLAVHNHVVATPVSNAAGTVSTATNNYLANSAASGSITAGDPNARMSVTANSYATSSTPGSTMPAYQTAVAGTATPTPIATEPPSLVINYCIALYGQYPARN